MNNANGDGRRDSLDEPHDEPGEYDDEDHTARFGVGKRKSTLSTTSASSNDTVSALDRVKSLAKRNQEVRYHSIVVVSFVNRVATIDPFYPCHRRHSTSSVGCD